MVVRSNIHQNDFMMKLDLKDAYNLSTTQEISALCVSGEDVQVPVSPLWPVLRPAGVYQATEASDNSYTLYGNPNSDVHR